MSPEVAFLLLGLAASIPLSIAANLLTGRVERWLGRRSQRRAAQLDARDAALRDRVHVFVDSPSAYQEFLFEMTLRALAGVVGMLLLAFAILFTALMLAIRGARPLTAGDVAPLLILGLDGFLALAFMVVNWITINLLRRALATVILVKRHRQPVTRRS